MTEVFEVRRRSSGELAVLMTGGLDIPGGWPDAAYHTIAEFSALADEMLELQSHDRRGFTASMVRRVYAKHNAPSPGTPVLQNVEPDEADLGFGATTLPDPAKFYAKYNKR